MTSDDLSELVKPHLRRRERLVWVGRPKPAAFVPALTWLATVFGVGFVGVIFTVLFMAWQHGTTELALGGIVTFPFLWIGLTFLRVPYLEYQQGTRVIYAVTDRRALIVRRGPPDAVKSYQANDLMDFEVAPGLILFAGDSALDGFMPGHRGQPETLVSAVGFVGLAPEVVPDVQRHLEAVKTAQLDEGLDLVESRRSADPDRIYEVATRYEVAREKLETWGRNLTQAESQRQFKTYGGCLKGVLVLAAIAGIGLIALAVVLNNRAVIEVGLMFVAPPLVILGGLGLVYYLAMTHAFGGRVQKRPQAFGFLDRLAGDRHPDTHLYGWLDLGDIRGVRPVRMANSPHSGALKTYHKHHWARFALGLADGNALAVSLIDKVKLKTSTEMSRRHFMRGRLSVNPARYDTARLTEPFTAGQLTAVPQVVGDRVVVYFGGEIGTPEEMPEQLAALYRMLPERA